ncbi:hypothetical protein Chor_009323 [Crotalus horridus]
MQLFLSQVYRHGDRSPLSTYPTDPHKAAAWPHGFQQLSEVGVLQQKALGQFLRERYAGFLSPSYKPQEIYVRSTDYDRTIMSAQANLMGLYPNSHPEIPWKPVPIHTVPTKYDKLLKPPTRSCQRYQQLMEETINLPSYQAKLREWKVPPSNRFSQPSTSILGLLLGAILSNFSKMVCQDLPLKMIMYSAHDSTLIALQAALGVYSGRPPPYAACHGFEFYQEGNNSFSVAMFYRNRSDQRPHILPLPGCPTPCPLPLFIHLTRTAVPEDWDAECQNPQSGPGRAVIALATTVGVLSVALIGMGVLYWRR